MTGRGSPADAMRTSDVVALIDSPGTIAGECSMERDARVLGHSLFVALTRIKNDSITGVYGDVLNEQNDVTSQ